MTCGPDGAGPSSHPRSDGQEGVVGGLGVVFFAARGGVGADADVGLGGVCRRGPEGVDVVVVDADIGGLDIFGVAVGE